MITIIHGDDLKSSRNFLTEQKIQSTTHLNLDGSSLDITELIQALSGDGLFEEKRDIFIEQLLTKRKKSKELDTIISTINSHADKSIFLWEGKALDKKTLASFHKATERSFKLPQMIFTFLDSLQPNNSSLLLKQFHQVLENVESEMLFAMLIRQIRLLLSVSHSSQNPIEEVKRLQPWQIQKLKKQSNLFAEKDLISHFSKLYEIDYQMKTGRSSLPLSSAIDIWLLKL